MGKSEPHLPCRNLQLWKSRGRSLNQGWGRSSLFPFFTPRSLSRYSLPRFGSHANILALCSFLCGQGQLGRRLPCLVDLHPGRRTAPPEPRVTRFSALVQDDGRRALEVTNHAEQSKDTECLVFATQSPLARLARHRLADPTRRRKRHAGSHRTSRCNAAHITNGVSPLPRDCLVKRLYPPGTLQTQLIL